MRQIVVPPLTVEPRRRVGDELRIVDAGLGPLGVPSGSGDDRVRVGLLDGGLPCLQRLALADAFGVGLPEPREVVDARYVLIGLGYGTGTGRDG